MKKIKIKKPKELGVKRTKKSIDNIECGNDD